MKDLQIIFEIRTDSPFIKWQFRAGNWLLNREQLDIRDGIAIIEPKEDQRAIALGRLNVSAI